MSNGPAGAVQGFVNTAMSTVTAPIDAANLAIARATLDLLEVLPKMPAARLYQDLVFQFGHSHPHPPSFGFPIPSVGPVLASGCMSVLINGLPAARNGDMGLSGWCGGYFPIFEFITGSSHVFIGGARAARQMMDPTLHCLPDPLGGKWGIGRLDIAMAIAGVGISALGMAAAVEGAFAAEERESDAQGTADAEAAAASAAAAGVGAATAAAQLAADVAATAMGLLMGKDPGVGFPLGMAIMGSPNVMIGGFPMPGWMNILKGLFRLLRPLIRRIQLRMPEGRMRNALCPLTGHPVEVVTGRMFTSSTDFEIDGRIPIRFDRQYDTSAVDYEGPLGWGWTHHYDQHLWESRRYNCLVLRNEENRQVRFDKLAVGEKFFQPLERIWLERTSEFEYKLTDCKTALIYKFALIDSAADNIAGEKNALPLVEISDRSKNKLAFTYKEGRLAEIANGSGTFVSLHYSTISDRTRLTEIRHHLRNGQDINLMRFGYNDDAEFISAANRTNVPYKYLYKDHLLTRETNRNGLSFYFEYEGIGPTARCIHTWGDGGIFERWITYHPKAMMTRVKDGLGGETIYHYNDLDLVTKIFNPEGGVVQFEYGESGELLKEIDELLRTRTYTYDERLNCISVMQEDGTRRSVVFNEFSEPIIIKDESGGQWVRETDANGNVTAKINPLGARREYDYNRFGDIVAFRDALGNETEMAWNAAGQITSLIRPRGGSATYFYNERDFLTEIKNEVTGLKQTYQYDDAGRIVRIARINTRGEMVSVERYEYDDQDNLLRFIDALGNKEELRYAGYNKLIERVDALGFKRRFHYDSEERLKEIINERGEKYSFDYDLNGRLIQEIGFDCAKRISKYDQAGDVVYQQDALKRETFFRRDNMGRVTSRIRSDGTSINYFYDECGRLVKAQNAENIVSLIYNAAWRVVEENQNGQVASYEHDLEGRRIARRLNDGKIDSRVDYDYDADSNLSLIRIDGAEINYERDELGRLTGRQMPNGLREHYDYSIDGRLNGQKVTVGVGGREIVRREYQWDALGNMVLINDSLRGPRVYGYDAMERLTKVERIIAGEDIRLSKTDGRKTSGNVLPKDKRLWQAEDRSGLASGTTREVEEFQYDGDGNLVERNSNVRGSRRFRYGKGDMLEQQEKIRYIYDAVGNLIQKRQADGSIISYEYDPDNQLTAVSSESGGRIEFRYDAFGRRTAKITEKGTTGFLWDGNVLFCEKKDSRSSSEYVHDGYVPLARISDSELHTYHTDFLGTPKEVSDQKGEIVWQGNYDEYGRITTVKGTTEQNIRFQGQYEDAETGLFYNRFRYYDPDAGRYINQDPIALNGGLNLYGYCLNPINWVDELGLVAAPANLPDTDGIYIITNGNDSYVGSSGIGDQGMNTRTSSSKHTNAQNLLARTGTTVQYVEIHGLSNVTASGGRTADGNRNVILRYYEQKQLDYQARSKNMLNGRRADNTLARILSPEVMLEAEALIKKHGITRSDRRKTC